MNGELNPELVLRKIVRGDYIYHRQEELEALQAEVNAGCGIYSPEQNQQRVALQKEGEHASYCLSVIYAGQHDYGLNLTTLDSGRPAYGGGQCVGMTLQKSMIWQKKMFTMKTPYPLAQSIYRMGIQECPSWRLHGRTNTVQQKKYGDEKMSDIPEEWNYKDQDE